LKIDGADNKCDSPNKFNQYFPLLPKYSATLNPDQTQNATELVGLTAGECSLKPTLGKGEKDHE
jgi:hypothetical protein